MIQNSDAKWTYHRLALVAASDSYMYAPLVSDPQQQQPPPTTPPPTASPAAASPGELSIPRFFSDKWYCGHDLLRELKSVYSSALNSSIGLVKIFQYLHPSELLEQLNTTRS
jgi:hypothetical protein